MPKQIADKCYHYRLGVPQGHICTATIVIVGEAPGENERKQGIPFVGMSGRLLLEWQTTVGIKQSNVYYTNVLPYQPPHNDIKLIPQSELEDYAKEMVARISTRCPQATIIVPTGATALKALTGQAQITKWRGSILEAQLTDRKVKCIPTLHPAYALREPGIASTCLADWRRVARDSKFPELDLPKRVLQANPRAVERRDFLVLAKSQPDRPISIDIENSATDIICVGFAISPSYGISVKFQGNEAYIKELCELQNPKVGQTLLHDAFWLRGQGIEIVNYKWDTACEHHALDPNAGPTSVSKDDEDPAGGRSRIKPYSLAYMASIFTREPYWKEEAKEDGEFIKVNGDASKLERLMLYNAKDACVTLEIHEVLLEKLKEAGKLEFYERHYSDLYYPLLDLMCTGVRLDVGNAEDTARGFAAECGNLRSKASQLAGIPLHSVKVYKRIPKDYSPESVAIGEFVDPVLAKRVYGSEWVRNTGKSISTDKLKHYLYDGKREGGLGLPKRTHKGKVTVDESALQGLRLRFPEHGELLDTVLEFRRTEKLASFISSGKCDSDGRLRCQYKQLVQTGRLSSAANPKGTGCNLQNFDRELRHLVLPDKMVLIKEVDDETGNEKLLKVDYI